MNGLKEGTRDGREERGQILEHDGKCVNSPRKGGALGRWALKGVTKCKFWCVPTLHPNCIYKLSLHNHTTPQHTYPMEKHWIIYIHTSGWEITASAKRRNLHGAAKNFLPYIFIINILIPTFKISFAKIGASKIYPLGQKKTSANLRTFSGVYMLYVFNTELRETFDRFGFEFCLRSGAFRSETCRDIARPYLPSVRKVRSCIRVDSSWFVFEATHFISLQQFFVTVPSCECPASHICTFELNFLLDKN